MDMEEVYRILNSTLQEIRRLPITVGPGQECLNMTKRGPTAIKFLQNLDKYQAILLVAASILTFTTMGVSSVECLLVQGNVSRSKMRNKLYFLITLFPTAMCFCLVGMISPRAAALSTSCGLLYFLGCFYIYISLVSALVRRNPNDSQFDSVATKLSESGKRINFRVPPICCLIPCLPTPKASPESINLIKLLVVQGPIVRACVIFFEVCATVELGREANVIIQYTEMCALISTFAVVFGSHTFTRLLAHELQGFNMLPILKCISLALFSFSAQYPLLFQNFLQRLHLIQCGPLLSIPEIICNFMVICQLFVLNLLMSRALNPNENDLFDLIDEAPPAEEDLENYKKSLLTALLTPGRNKKPAHYDF